MNLVDLTTRGVPQPWSEGDNIPWNDPSFSRRMLREHLSQEHDAASRRSEIIDRHVDFIHRKVMGERPGRVLDLGCGPGLYAVRLARLGHSVRGIDFSPASIAYARDAARQQGLDCTFDHVDLRQADFLQVGMPAYDLVMLIYCEFNVFRPADAQYILSRAYSALKPGAILLLESSTAAAVRALGAESQHWQALSTGLFSDRPHLLLSEAFWDESTRAATHRYYVADTGSGEVVRFAASYQAYEEADFRSLLAENGFVDVCFYPSLTGEDPSPSVGSPEQEFIVITARALKED